MVDETISEKCENLYNKLNSFVESEISRDVTPQISNLNSRINALEPNLVRVKEVSGNISSVSAGGTSTKTFTVPACPSGYGWKYFSTSTGWGTVNSVSLSGTTLTVTLLNVSNTSHDISFSGALVYYPTTIKAEPHISMTATNPYLLEGEVTDLVVSLVDEFGLPLNNKNITIGQSVFIDNGTTANHNDSWSVTNGTMTRMDSYTRLVESTETLMCQMNTGYITPTSTVEFDFKAVDGVKNWGLIYIRNGAGGTSLANLSLDNIGGDIGEWIHLKIVFNNTDTITIYSSKLSNPITRTLSSTDSNYRLLLFGGRTNTELHFKNVIVYETIKGITNNNGLFTLSDVEVSSGYKTFTATYGTLSDSVDVFLCTSYDYGTNTNNTSMWSTTNFTLSRENSYTTLIETANTGICTSDSNHKISPTQTLEFDICQVDGTKYYAPIYIRNDNGGVSLASISYSELNANVGEWVHMKIVFNNTSTITIYADTLAEPITKTLSATSTNYRLMLYGTNTITTLYFKNVAIY